MHATPYSISDIADITQASTWLSSPDDTISELAYDSRKLQHIAQTHIAKTLFFALDGQRDGHDFIPHAYQAGVRNFIIQHHKINVSAYPHANFLSVDDPLAALQMLARYHRQQYKGKVIAITGSNGKTIVKEWLYQLLSPDFLVVRSPKSYNSQIGVALSLWQLDDRYDFALIEAGISQPHEMEALEKMIQPTIGVLTNIKEAHRENFPSRQAITQEKLRLFEHVQTLIYAPSYVQENSIPAASATFTWCFGSLTDPTDTDFQDADLTVSIHRTVSKTSFLKIFYRKEKHSEEHVLEIPFNDNASIENTIICCACLLYLGYSVAEIQKRLRLLSPIQMRLALKKGINHCSIIDDSYSNDIASLGIALDFLYQQHQHEDRILIFSDLPEINAQQEESVYRQIALLIKQRPLTLFVGIGPALTKYKEFFDSTAQFYLSTQAFLDHFPFSKIHDCSVLIKGARVFAFEKISQRLVQKNHETVLGINLNAIQHNLKTYRAQLSPSTKVMAMVKAFSYGSGSFEIANILQYNHVDYLAVAYTDEGIALRNAGITLPIMVMNADLSQLHTLLAYHLEPEIFSFDILEAFAQTIAEADASYPIHIKIETGMNRLGFHLENESALVAFLKKYPRIRVASVFSHLAAAGDPQHDAFSQKQIHQLKTFSASLQKQLPYSFLTHIANTAAIVRFPEAQLDMVRLGIGLYGIGDDHGLRLEPAMMLTSVVSQIKYIQPQDTVGYNRRGRMPEGGRIAIVKIGYADGYDRRFGNGIGVMRIGQQIAHTIGDICMDMCMLDVTHLDVHVGDTVVVFADTPRLEQLATAIQTIPYELLTGISQRVKRVYYYE